MPHPTLPTGIPNDVGSNQTAKSRHVSNEFSAVAFGVCGDAGASADVPPSYAERHADGEAGERGEESNRAATLEAHVAASSSDRRKEAAVNYTDAREDIKDLGVRVVESDHGSGGVAIDGHQANEGIDCRESSRGRMADKGKEEKKKNNDDEEDSGEEDRHGRLPIPSNAGDTGDTGNEDSDEDDLLDKLLNSTASATMFEQDHEKLVSKALKARGGEHVSNNLTQCSVSSYSFKLPRGTLNLCRMLMCVSETITMSSSVRTWCCFLSRCTLLAAEPVAMRSHV